MSLLEEIAASTSAPGGVCTIGTTLRDRPDIADDLRSALTNLDIPASAISLALKGRGIAIGDYTVNRHRRGRCLCRRS